MAIDTDKIDAAILARLHAKGLIQSLVGRARSVALTAAGLAQSERLFTHFAPVKPPPPTPSAPPATAA